MVRLTLSLFALLPVFGFCSLVTGGEVQQNHVQPRFDNPSYLGLAQFLQQRQQSLAYPSDIAKLAQALFHTLPNADLLTMSTDANITTLLSARHDLGADWKAVIEELVKLVKNWIMKIVTRGIVPGVSANCVDAIGTLLMDLVKLNTTTGKAAFNPDPWALQFFDAMGKPEAGLLDGNLFWYGSRDECADIQPVDKAGKNRGFAGRYCVADVGLPQEMIKSALMPQKPNGLNLGMCVPDRCTKHDFDMLWADMFKDIAPILMNNTALRNYTAFNLIWSQCDRVGHEAYLDGPAIAVVAVIGGFTLLVAFGTLFDALFTYWQRERANAIVEPAPSAATTLTAEANGVAAPQPLTKKPADLSRLPLWARFFMAFSAISNGRKILATTANRPISALHKNAHLAATTTTQLHSVHGIRFLSMTWVIIGHTYAFSIFIVSDQIKLLQISKEFLFHIVMSGSVAVDTFFMLSGMLVVYLFLQEWHKRKRMNWLLYYFHRYWRLTPVYMICLGVVAGLMPFLITGPNQFINDSWAPDRCANSWWTNLVYLNNFLHFDDQCIGWTWYLANDMQFYVFAPLVLVPLAYISTWVGVGVLVVLFAAHIVSTAVITTTLDLPINFFTANLAAIDRVAMERYFKWYYMRPWTRVGPYLVGILLGLILFKWQQANAARKREHRASLRLPWMVVVLGWILAAGVSLAVVFSLYPMFRDETDYVLWVRALFNSTSRIGWALSIGWVIFACEAGYGGFIDTILSWQALVPLSRLTYCAYLFHLPVITLVNGNMTQEMAFSHLTFVLHNFGFIVASYLLAFVVSVIFEAPMLGLEKILLGGMGGGGGGQAGAQRGGGGRVKRSYEVAQIHNQLNGPTVVVLPQPSTVDTHHLVIHPLPVDGTVNTNASINHVN